jgi:hypothetical protein
MFLTVSCCVSEQKQKYGHSMMFGVRPSANSMGTCVLVADFSATRPGLTRPVIVAQEMQVTC